MYLKCFILYDFHLFIPFNLKRQQKYIIFIAKAATKSISNSYNSNIFLLFAFFISQTILKFFFCRVSLHIVQNVIYRVISEPSTAIMEHYKLELSNA